MRKFSESELEIYRIKRRHKEINDQLEKMYKILSKKADPQICYTHISKEISELNFELIELNYTISRRGIYHKVFSLGYYYE
jgi:phage-related tail protein